MKQNKIFLVIIATLLQNAQNRQKPDKLGRKNIRNKVFSSAV
jgi:hypothetical protein